MKEDRKDFAGWKQLIRNWFDRIIAQKWFDVGLRNKMGALVTVGLTGLIAIFAFMGITTIRQTTQQFLAEHVLRARILAENLDTTLSQVGGMLTILSTQIDMNDPQSSLDEWGEVFQQDFHSIQGVYLFGRNSNLMAAAGDLPGVDWKQIPALRVTPETAERVISTEGLPRPYAIIVVPVQRGTDRTPIGMLAAVLDLSNPDVFLSSGSLDSDHLGTLQILSGSGQVLGSTSTEQVLTVEMIDKILANLYVEGKPMVEACLGCTENEMDETGTVIAFAPLSNVPWGVVIWHDAEVLFAPVHKLALQTSILGALAILGAFVLVFVTTRSVIAPVQMLTDATHRISEVQFDTSTLKSVECTLADSLAKQTGRRRDEIGLLSNSFITMCTRLQLSMQEIQSLNRNLDERVQSRTQQLSILNAVALTVNQSLNLDNILNRALDEVLQLTGIDIVAIFLQDTSKGELKLCASRGLSENAARMAYQVGLLDSSCGGVMELGRAVVVPDLSPYRGRGAQSLKRERINALMHVPLITKGYALGSMCVGTRENLQFDSEEQSLLTAIGNQIAIAVENARLYAEVQRKERIRGELLTKALAAQEDERKRIARELHDDVSQSLTALLYEAEDGLEMDAQLTTQKRLQSICDLTQHTLDNIHKLIFDLRPSMLDQLGLVPAVRWLAETRLESRGLRVTVNASSASMEKFSDDHRLAPEIETGLYRVIQEAINNIARHAAARNVEISLELENETFRVSIIDDGIGFDWSELNIAANKNLEENNTDTPETMRGLGLMGMQERIELLGGELEILTTLGNGTQVHIHVPLHERSLAYD
ncbi:MAG: GAF domain-containing protein [Chloroflexota bacterium]